MASYAPDAEHNILSALLDEGDYLRRYGFAAEYPQSLELDEEYDYARLKDNALARMAITACMS